MAVFNKVNRQEKGSVTIEATIALSAFMFAIVTILTIVNICIAQARIFYAINTTAKEISQYSYLYSLTGFSESQQKLYGAAKVETDKIDQVLSDVNTVYNEIENLGEDAAGTPQNIDGVLNAWDKLSNDAKSVEGAGSSLQSDLESIASDPKSLMFGIVKMAASDGFDLAKSRLIAAPLAKTMCKKHLVNKKGGDVETYLKFLGIVPSASGKYIDGLDFSKSTLFPRGSNEITINVSYDVKVIALLPIDFSFHFNQTAITHGWLAGEDSYKNAENRYKDNDTIWTKATVTERSEYIRHLAIADLEDEGYKRTTGLTDVQLYNPDTNEFVMISSMNPLYSPSGEEPMTLDDLDDVALQESIERLCAKMKSTTDGLSNVTTKTTDKNGQVTKKDHNCSGANNKIVLVIPEDEGLKEKIEEIIAKSNTNGVTIEVTPSFGKGVNSTEVKSNGGK